MYSPKIQRLIDLFVKFPGVGPRTAARLVFYLVKADRKEVQGLGKAIFDLKKSLNFCSFCFKSFKVSGNKLCEICSDPRRDKTLLCVIEKEIDLASIEKNKLYKGLYFILGGSISKLKKEDINRIRIKELKERIKNPRSFGIDSDLKEIILALNPTVEGESTSLYLERELKDLDKKITRLGRGLPSGAELEYADEKTLISAFKNRK